MVQLYYTDSQTLSPAVLERWLPRIHPEKAERLRRSKLEDAKASIAGELLLRYGMWKTFGISPKSLQTAPDVTGKPQVISHEGVHFNISHSGFHCICAVSDCPVGVDLQEIRPIRFQKLANRFFTPEELGLFAQWGATEDAFFTLWARKEALGKLSGRGLRPGATEQGVIVLEKSFQNCKICVMSSP